jgi:hypothetical protein
MSEQLLPVPAPLHVAMTPQAMAEKIAKVAKPRLLQLLKLKIPHVYDPTPGRPPAKISLAKKEVVLDKLRTTSQPYRDIERFVSAEKIVPFLIDPGLLPIVKSILLDIRGRDFLVTRAVAPKGPFEGATAQLDDFGMRVLFQFDEAKQETVVIWECFYGVG